MADHQGSQYKRYMGLLERVQRRTTRKSRVFEQCSHEERLNMLRLFCLEKRRLQRELSAAFQSNKGTWNTDGQRHFISTCSNRSTTSGFILKDLGGEQWSRLPRESVDASSLKLFKACLDVALINLVQWKALKTPPNQNNFMILC